MRRPSEIVVDVYETTGRVPDALSARGVSIRVDRLAAGDYDLGHGIVVERKTTPDLHLSLQRGRLWRQIGALRSIARLPFLLVEGETLAGPLEPDAIRGACLAVVGQGVPLLRTRDPTDSAAWLDLMAQRADGVRPSRDRPVYAQRLKPMEKQVAEAMLATVPGISVVGARALLDRFGSITKILAAGHDAWVTVPGIGPKRADALEKAVT